MRIPNNFTDEFAVKLNELYHDISERYLESIVKRIQIQKVNVMLADASVTQQDTFEPQKVALFYEVLGRRMKNWSSEGISKTDTDDLRRLHVLFTTFIGKYSLSCYFGIQYHALPFYKFDNRVKDIQVEIMELDEKVSAMKEEIMKKGNAILEEELKKRNISNSSFEELLETMYNDQQLYNELVSKVDELEKSNPEYLNMSKRKEELVNELKNMIVELYIIRPVLVDHNQLMQGEEGVSVYFDLEIVWKGEKSGTIEMEKVPDKVKHEIIERFEEVKTAVKET